MIAKNRNLPELFDFGDALYFLKVHNSCVSRLAWKNDNKFIGLPSPKNEITAYYSEKGIVTCYYYPTQDDLLADDWFVYDKNFTFAENIEQLF